MLVHFVEMGMAYGHCVPTARPLEKHGKIEFVNLSPRSLNNLLSLRCACRRDLKIDKSHRALCLIKVAALCVFLKIAAI